MAEPLLVADRCIPFLKGRLEPFARVTYIEPDAFSPDTVNDADGLLIRTRTRCNEELLRNSRVRFIATGTIGMDQIDMPYCLSRGIDVNNSPGCNAPGVAQYVWASLLHLGIDPRGLKVGVVGCGNVGSVVVEWGRHLGAEMLVNDPPKEKEIDGSRCDIEWHSLDDLLSVCDVVTLHVPYTKTGKYATNHLIGEKEIALMRPGAILINAARGPVADNAAVARAVGEGRIRAIIDTWEGEPDAINRELLHNALIATPHIAGYSLQGKQRATRMILEAVERFYGFSGIDYTGLAERYTPLSGITAEEIMASYNPLDDTAMLRSAPSDFERMRDSYIYRSEP